MPQAVNARFLSVGSHAAPAYAKAATAWRPQLSLLDPLHEACQSSEALRSGAPPMLAVMCSWVGTADAAPLHAD